jgi:hypothetical protein
MGLRKIDRAIAILTQFRELYIKGWKLHRAWRKKYDVRELARQAKNKSKNNAPHP